KVAIAGRVTDAQTGKFIGAAEIVMTSMPESFRAALETAGRRFGSRWAMMAEGPDRARARGGGLFYFLALPNGNYSVKVSLPSAGKRYGSVLENATVSRDANGNLKMVFLTFALNPTTVAGKITGSGHKGGIVMADVRIKGSGEHAYTDARGQYLL